MHYKYVVILRRDSERMTNALSFLLCLSTALFLLFAAATSFLTITPPVALAWFDAIIGLILLTGLAVNLAGRRAGRTRIRYRYLLLIAALGWLGSLIFPWLSLFFVLLAFLEYQTRRPLEIGFDSDRIVINSLIRRRYDWSDLSNVILRDGLLTIDFKNNRLLQKEVMDDDEDEDDADEKEFNDYCRARLSEVFER
ncbi:MAG TPA: hypothetical protein VHC48_15825 [Puia sp.]|jgi:hypothetical protein|nr:hypothetical protein [Puia sp.]